ncbi:hypothetical protein [Prosthecobacter vanneervenii]|uniref:Uncharacterized protein n=1 Tax=Prosthecobacter vanneervenii TaxID=48466 RepID=A0A7W7YFW3_9BACT|nr:hypothetical protein [Prosthecobacter vanneervenii]MBB5035364.1 hypothetical protein [Prosthecobacter vanneervenii]
MAAAGLGDSPGGGFFAAESFEDSWVAVLFGVSCAKLWFEAPFLALSLDGFLFAVLFGFLPEVLFFEVVFLALSLAELLGAAPLEVSLAALFFSVSFACSPAAPISRNAVNRGVIIFMIQES